MPARSRELVARVDAVGRRAHAVEIGERVGRQRRDHDGVATERLVRVERGRELVASSLKPDVRARHDEPRVGERARELRRREAAEAGELDTRDSPSRRGARAPPGKSTAVSSRNVYSCTEIGGGATMRSWRLLASHGADLVRTSAASLCSGSRPQAGEAGRMPALTRNRRFARSSDLERTSRNTRRGGLHTNRRGMRGGARAFLPDLAPCARCAGGVVSEGPARVASRRPLAKGTPYGNRLQGASWIARTRGQHRHEHRRSSAPPPAPRARRRTDQPPARATRRAVARQPDQAQRRLPQELRRSPTRSTPRTR